MKKIQKNNYRYFVVSDIHSFFTALIKGLDQAGFDIQNENHILIICGDIFDRGSESVLLYNYLKSIPRDRLILIRGNHEYLLRELLKKPFPQAFDFSNGTVKTMCSFVDGDEKILETYWLDPFAAIKYWRYVVKEFKKLKIVEWIFSKDWVNYYELDTFIFVHSFIPLKTDIIAPNYDLNYYVSADTSLHYWDYWRLEAKSKDWELANWSCPWQLYSEGKFDSEIKKGKILVCGHYDAADFHAKFEKVTLNSVGTENHTSYISSNLIAIDGCTVLSGFVNCIVIEKPENKKAYLVNLVN